MTGAVVRTLSGDADAAKRAPGARLYHYILSLEWVGADRIVKINTMYGRWNVRPGDSRQNLYLDILELAQREFGAAKATTLYFSLEPDVIGDGEERTGTPEAEGAAP